MFTKVLHKKDEMIKSQLKRPKTKCVFKSFETQAEYQVFLPSGDDPFQAVCSVCPNKATINVKYKGRTALDLHLKTAKHVNSYLEHLKTSPDNPIIPSKNSCRVCLKNIEDGQDISEYSMQLEKFGGIVVSL